MPTIYVAVDLETTGLSAETCEIIEVGAVKFTPEGEVATFHTPVKPRGALPYYIQRLTGIRPDDLEHAPIFAEVASDLEVFIGDNPIVGQNVFFDLGFLAAQGIRPPGPTFDTHDLATLLLPGLPEYSLRSLARHLGVEFPVRHRALADAEATLQVFLHLRGRLGDLPASLLGELNRIATEIDWPLRRLFDEMLQEAPLLSAGAPMVDAMPLPVEIGAPLVPRVPPQPIAVDEVEAVLRSPEANPELFPEFELRDEQLAMAREVAEALNSGQPLIVEAGTGTGKSLAYLTPAAYYALQNDARVIVSTDTINLQEQLMGKDIPLLQRLIAGTTLMDAKAAAGLRFAQLKGRRNYLCMLRFATLRRSPSLSVAEGQLLARILVWLRQTETGDRAELSLSSQEDSVWQGLSADSETCLSFACQYARHGACFLQRARRRAEASHIVVVNHALLLSDIAVGGHVLPEYRHLVVDEAHNLEDEATSQFGFQATDSDVRALVDRVHHRLPRGRAGGLVESLRQQQRAGRPYAQSPDLAVVADDLASEAENARRALPLLFDLLSSFLFDRAAEQGDYDPRLLLNRAMRVQPDWSNVEVAWENLDVPLGKITRLLGRVNEDATPEEGAEEIVAEISGVLQEARRLRDGIASVLARDDVDTIAWMTYGRSSSSVMLCAAPLQVADTLRARLFADRESAVLTGATLSVAGRFNYVAGAVGLDEPRELMLGSPFDYARSTLMLIPSDVPEPNSTAYQEEFEAAVVDLCRASEGRALVLFTSYGSLGATHTAVRRHLEHDGILVLGQGIDGPPKSLLNALRENARTVILGTSSFWEGVDVAGEALSLLVIARLPFAVPSDPIYVARSELYEDPFQEYALPQAVIRFKQGFGRLIRRKTDRGVVVVMDRRLRSKTYGASFLRSIPPCTVRDMPLRELPVATTAWLAGKSGEGDPHTW
jgi:DNA polymerase-3 subunit epsilon/ATP-dependent DNA helicase DinG